jgi:DNA-directed RNA polymerase II subunit RPB2
MSSINNMQDSKSLSEIDKKEFFVSRCFEKNKNNVLVKHLIESFNDFVLKKLDDIIDGFNPIEINSDYLQEENIFKNNVNITISNPTITKPMITEKDGSTKIMTPSDARNRNFTYSSPLYIDIYVETKVYNDETKTWTEESKKVNNIMIGKLPIMIKSKYCVLNTPSFNIDECRYDYGGYFIINGNEKVIVSQDRIAENKTYVFLNNKCNTYSHVAEIRSVHENKFSVPKTTTLKLTAKANQFGKQIRVNIHHIKHDIPIIILFRALGIQTDKEISKYIFLHENENDILLKELMGSLEEGNNVRCQRDAYEYLSKYLVINRYNNKHNNQIVKSKKLEIITDVLTNEFLPHCGTSFSKKALFIGTMVSKLIKCNMGITPFDDRDSYINKRVDTPGVLIANLFRQYYGKMIKDAKNMLSKDINNPSWKSTSKLLNIINNININKIFKSTTIESGLKYGFATGNWGIKTNKTKQGVAQVLNRLTYMATISHLRRIITPVEKAGKLVQPRKLHSTQFGIICPAETPEGSSVGLVKNMSLLASITIASHSETVRNFIMQEDIEVFDGSNIDIFEKLNTKVVVNGDIIGITKSPVKLYNYIKSLKTNGHINIYTGVNWDVFKNEISVFTEGGRCVRPLIRVENGKSCLTAEYITQAEKENHSWTSITKNTLEYIDVEEANQSLIGMSENELTTRHTHIESDPAFMLGVLAASIPFSNHNQSPRNCYQSSMGKQAIGIYTSNYRKRFDTVAHVLNYPQKPLVQTRMGKILNNNSLPCGMNAIVAIATYTGFNQEDSIMLNKGSIDRGMFLSTSYKTYKEQNNKNHSTGEEEFFCNPTEVSAKNIKPFNYNKVDSNGFVAENSFVKQDDIIIGKCMPNKDETVIYNKDTSVVLKANEQGFVDKNFITTHNNANINGDGYTFAKVRVRNTRTPCIGDKFSSRHGQKGTVGMIYNQEDMPFMQDGTVPDIIINPHAIPSRMTIAQLMECILGKACCINGSTGDGSPFNQLSVQDISKVLEENGMERTGNEVMYNSRTGEQMNTLIFCGPTYYQRLKHMVNDKIHSRSSAGPVVLLTRQPAEGRARDGGLRLGEMEVECNWAHGISSFLKERFMECSDNYRLFICRKCSMPATVNKEKNLYVCKPCRNKSHFSQIRVPYATKLMFQEVQTMSIATRYICNN